MLTVIDVERKGVRYAVFYKIARTQLANVPMLKEIIQTSL